MLNKPYQTQNVPLVNYDYTDLLTGTAYKIFYAGYASTPFLISSTPGSDVNHICSIGSGTLSATLVKVFDVNYPSTFDMPQTIIGNAIASFSHGLGGAASDPQVCSHKTEVEIQKNSVYLISGSTVITTASPGTGNLSVVDGISLAVPETRFNKGDILTINVKGYASQGNQIAGRQIYYGIGTDPQDRNDDYSSKKVIEDTDSTRFEIHLPFKTYD